MHDGAIGGRGTAWRARPPYRASIACRSLGGTSCQCSDLLYERAAPGSAAALGVKAMKIAQVTPLYESVPPRLYGGTERVVAHLTDALVSLGHEVTLFASADARTSAELVSVRDQAIRLDPSPLKSDLAAHLSMMHEIRKRADDFDVIHFHVDLVHFPF